MARSLNEVKLIGYLTKDPVVRQTQSKKRVANFSIATSEQWKDSHGEKQERVEYHDLTAWEGLAEVVNKYAKKGTRVYACGKLQTEQYEGEHGTVKAKVIVVNDLILLSEPEGAARKAA